MCGCVTRGYAKTPTRQSGTGEAQPRPWGGLGHTSKGVAMNTAKRRSRERIVQKLRQYQEKARPELEFPSASVIERMTCEQLVAWVHKHIRRDAPVNPTQPAVSEREVGLCVPLRRKGLSFRRIEQLLAWQDRHGKYVQEFCKGRGRNARRSWLAYKRCERAIA